MEYEQIVYQQDFLMLNFPEMDFFVNRAQFSGSTSIEKMGKIKSSILYFNDVFTYNEQLILLFDCDSFLQKTFQCEQSTSSRLCLLMKPEDFTLKSRPLIERLLNSNNRFSKEFLGLIIPARAEIKKISINEIYLPPAGLKKTLDNYGIYGCRFPQENRIQYYIDLEKNIINILKGRIK